MSRCVPHTDTHVRMSHTLPHDDPQPAHRHSERLRAVIKDELGLTTSAGISVNKLLAKLVASENKPNMQTVLLPTATALSQVLPSQLAVQRIPGIGFSATRRWNTFGVTTCLQLWLAAHTPTPEIHAEFSSKELELAAYLSAGLDSEGVKSSGAPKSIGAEDSFWTEPLVSMEGFDMTVKGLLKQILAKWQQDETVFGARLAESVCVSIKIKSDDPALTRRQSRQSKYSSGLPALKDPRALQVWAASALTLTLTLTLGIAGMGGQCRSSGSKTLYEDGGHYGIRSAYPQCVYCLQSLASTQGRGCQGYHSILRQG